MQLFECLAVMRYTTHENVCAGIGPKLFGPEPFRISMFACSSSRSLQLRTRIHYPFQSSYMQCIYTFSGEEVCQCAHHASRITFHHWIYVVLVFGGAQLEKWKATSAP